PRASSPFFPSERVTSARRRRSPRRPENRMARNRPPRRRLVCYWCAEPLTLSITVIAEGWVWHRRCFEYLEVEIAGPACCLDCGYPAATRGSERPESCRCHLAPLIYGDDAT